MSHEEHDAPTLDLEELRIPPGHPWMRIPWIGLALGAVGFGACLLLGRSDPRQFYFSWLVAFLFFLSIALGGLFFVLVHFAAKAGWSVAVRRIAEQAMVALPLFALLFLPILFGMHELFHWTHADAVAHDPLLQWKAPYLNQGFFVLRAGLYFACWTILAVFMYRQSTRQDRTGDPAITRRLQNLSPPALAVFALTTSFAAIDWIMSLDPHWYSTILGVYYFAGCLVGIYAFMIVVMTLSLRAGLSDKVLTSGHFHDLGKLLFAFTVFWAYIAFSQYFLIWYGNIPEETVFYVGRLQGSWRSLSAWLAVGHFVIPFFFLMRAGVKRRPLLLLIGAVWMLLMHLLDLFWLVMPVLHEDRAQLGWLDVTSLLAVGGFFLAAFGWSLRSVAILPIRDPRLSESLSL
jgi:hypothetical protein